MFNTELIHFLQQFDNSIFYWFMVLISTLGTTVVVLPFVLIVTFVVDFKKGLVLLNIVAWTAIATFIMKEQVNFPRPVDVDSKVKTIYFEKAKDDLLHLQPNEFLESFSSDLLKVTRNDEWDRFGFPSGHTSIQIALWMTLFYLFKRKRVLYFGIFMSISTIISRLYLAHHFLGDVIGGALLGFLVAYLLLLLVHKTAYLTTSSQQFKSLSILWIPLILTPFVYYTPVWVLGSLIGFNASALLIILQRNFPIFHVITWKRIVSAVLILAFISASYLLQNTLAKIDGAGFELILVVALNFIVVWGSINLSNRLNLIRFRF